VKTLFSRPEALKDARTHYCAGCGHGIVHRLVAEVIDELGIRERTVGVAPVGCAVLAYDYFNVDMSEAAHGRVPAVATGLKRALADRVVFGYQGDGDLASIGMSEIIHAANRGENISIVFVNNAVYGMTGGQMAPTTLVGQKTATTPRGRNTADHGNPIRICELLATLNGPVFLARAALGNPAGARKVRKYLLAAFKAQMEQRGFSLVEILAACPTYWRMTPVDSMRFIGESMTATFPPGVFRGEELLNA
jgi:2-oxoglutarate/2-oxoacid ferredoxin oxidoreductase subunit beta